MKDILWSVAVLERTWGCCGAPDKTYVEIPFNAPSSSSYALPTHIYNLPHLYLTSPALCPPFGKETTQIKQMVVAQTGGEEGDLWRTHLHKKAAYSFRLLLRRNSDAIGVSYYFSPTNTILLPGSNWYWVSWYNAQISVGYGNVVGSNLIATYHDPSSLPTTSLYVGTYVETAADWLIPASCWSQGSSP